MKTIRALMMEVMGEFSIELMEETACRDFFLRKLHPMGVFCPECKSEVISSRLLESFWNMQRIHCRDCGRSFSAVTGTVLNGIGIEWRALYMLLFLVGCGVRTNQISRPLGISNGAAYLWANKAKEKAPVSEDPVNQGGLDLEP
jgi:transposase-like protein